MVEYKERVLLPFSFEIEEEYIIFENQFEEQFESTQPKPSIDCQSIGELSKAAEYHKKHQTDHVFFDPIAGYMERFYSLDFQLYFHYEDQIYLMLPRLFQYHVCFCFKHSQEIQMSDQINDWLHWKFYVP